MFIQLVEFVKAALHLQLALGVGSRVNYAV
jgi:hypothetical protein